MNLFYNCYFIRYSGNYFYKKYIINYKVIYTDKKYFSNTVCIPHYHVRFPLLFITFTYNTLSFVTLETEKNMCIYEYYIMIIK